MKIEFLINRFFYFIIFLSSIIFFNSCDSDEDIDNTPQTFLEKYDGTKWVVSTKEFIIYLRLNNKTDKFVEQWIFYGECYAYKYESGDLEIVKNSEYELILKYTDEEVTETYIITVQGDVLRVVFQVNGEEDILYFEKTMINVDNFEICNPENNVTYVPDNDFEQKLIDLGYDYILDNYVLTNNIENVAELNIKSLGIKEITGIQGFKNLKILICEGNFLTSLDVSKNTSLTELTCQYNQITSIDVSKNTSLKILVSYHNQLTSLDVSNNKSLEKLMCFSDQLTSLDVSNNTSLKILWCGTNQLTSLDLSNNTKLIDLWCESNQLTSLDGINNTSLFELRCHGNQLTNLDVSNKTSLVKLFCHNNKLTSLDVSNNTFLNTLWCYSNEISCVKINANQLNNYTSSWKKDENATWSLDCN